MQDRATLPGFTGEETPVSTRSWPSPAAPPSSQGSARRDPWFAHLARRTLRTDPRPAPRGRSEFAVTASSHTWRGRSRAAPLQAPRSPSRKLSPVHARRPLVRTVGADVRAEISGEARTHAAWARGRGWLRCAARRAQTRRACARELAMSRRRTARTMERGTRGICFGSARGARAACAARNWERRAPRVGAAQPPRHAHARAPAPRALCSATCPDTRPHACAKIRDLQLFALPRKAAQQARRL